MPTARITQTEHTLVGLPGRDINVLRTFNLSPVSPGKFFKFQITQKKSLLEKASIILICHIEVLSIQPFLLTKCMGATSWGWGKISPAFF